MSETGNKRIVKNTLMLYLRMGLSMIIGLYTSRVILSVLGVDDYGIYGVVGSVVAMFGFLNVTLSGATGRYITYELGTGDNDKLNRTFACSLSLHIYLALFIVILAETLGLWALNTQLNIPADRMVAANWVYQFSIISTAISLFSIPYISCITAHEDFSFYAYVEILNVSLKLGIVFLLKIGDFDRLILYGVLVFAVTVLIFLTNLVFCLWKYSETRNKPRFDYQISKGLISFSGSLLLGSTALMTKRQGIVMILNRFFGVAVNAASSLALTVTGIIQGFTANVITAIRPQLIKLYAQGKIEEFCLLLRRAITGLVILMSCCSFPFIIEANYILGLWLKEVPPYTALFCQILLLSTPITTVETILLTANTATGKVFLQNSISSIILILQLPIVYLLFKFTHRPEWSAIVSSAATFILLCVSTFALKINLKAISVKGILFTTAKAYFLAIIIAVPFIFIQTIFESSIWRFLLITIFFIITSGTLSLYLLFSYPERRIIIAKAANLWSKIFNGRT